MARTRSLVLFGALALAACAEPTVPTPTLTREGGLAYLEGEQQYVLIGRDKLPSDLAARVAAAGGQVTFSQDFVALVTTSDPGFAGRASSIPGMQAVVRDQIVEFDTPRASLDIDALSTGVGATETFRLSQWNVDAVKAPKAWAKGNLGAGARVAVLDGGIHDAHIDFVGRIDVARSTSFTTGAFNTDLGTLWHGTHVAGIIAANNNGIGTVGVAPSATIIGVKVLHGGTGSFGGIIAGIMYASAPISEGGAGAHIINMSLGAYVVRRQELPDMELIRALNRATVTAWKRGVTLVAAAGNDAIDLDRPDTQGLDRKLMSVPAESHGVIAVSATGPLGFAQGATNFDRPASYTNFGKTAINIAAPGGDFALPGEEICQINRLPAGSGAVVFPCWVFDMVVSTSRGPAASISSYSWTAGTSMASPVVAGVAALVVGKYGPVHPFFMEALLRLTADDLGKRGRDDFYGSGRVNAAKALGLR